MDAKRIAVGLSGLLGVIMLIDFSSRLMVSVEVNDKQNQVSNTTTAISNKEAVVLSLSEVEKLLDWSDIKPKPSVAVAKVVVEEPVVVKPKVDIHKQVRQAIAGDKSKQLIGNDLLSLKGIFFDGENFAVVEIENITTKNKQYFRAKANENLATHQLMSIGKNLVEIKNGDKTVTLQMFDK